MRLSACLAALALAAALAGCAGGYDGGNSGGSGSPPLAPSGLIAAAANAQVNLSWTASSGASGYYIKRSTSSAAETQIRAFRGFDGANATFGDTSLQATSSSVQNVVVYASTDTTMPGRVVFVAINRSMSSHVVAITGQPLSGTAHLYQMTAATAQSQVAGGGHVHPVAAGTLPAGGSTLTVTLPALSVTTIDVN